MNAARQKTFGERKLNCYYCGGQYLETKIQRKQKGNEVILDCGKCRTKPKKYVKLLKRKVDLCQRV